MSAGLLALIASLPIVAIFVFMVGFRWPATRAMPVAFVIALILALTVWKTPTNWILAASANGLVIAMKIIFIVFGQNYPFHAITPGGEHLFFDAAYRENLAAQSDFTSHGETRGDAAVGQQADHACDKGDTC